MQDHPIDLLFSFRGRIGRQAWWLGLGAVAAAAVAGTMLFNDDSFDESANAVRGSLTMAAFLWLALCLVAATALSVKRLGDCGWPRWPAYAAGLSGAVAICGWGLGMFQHPLTVTSEALALWVLLAAMLPALVACAVLPTLDKER
jgi:uncharacterized membrane protein YhaH (DUF805 family)